MQLTRLPALLAVLWSSAASAQVCTFTNTGMDWGTVNLASGSAINLLGTLRATCTGNKNATVRVCPNFNAGSGGANASGSERYMLNGSTQLRYNLYSDGAYSTVWGSTSWGKTPAPPTLNVKLNNAGTGSKSLTIYGRILSGQSALPAGSYTSSFAGAQTQVAYAYSTTGNCTAIGLSNATNVPFAASATYGSTCAVSAGNMNFGSKGVLDSNTDAASTISVNCATGTSYTIGLSGGLTGATDPTQRRMIDAADTEDIIYGIYRDASRSLPWGSIIGSNTAAGTGTGSAQSFTAYGRVPPQPTPTPQNYTDTITVTVSY